MDAFSTSAVIAAALLLAGVVKGTLGLGLPVVAAGIMAFVMSPAQAAAILLVPIFATNLSQIFSGTPLGPLLRRLAPLIISAVIATLASSLLLAKSDAALPRGLLGMALIAYGLTMLTGLRLSIRPRDEWWLGTLAGASTGLIAGPTGVFLVPTVAYLQALGLEKDNLVQALSVTYIIAAAALVVGLALQDLLSLQQVAVSALAMAPAMLGLTIGTALRNRLDVDRFRQVFCAALLLLGSYLVAGLLVY